MNSVSGPVSINQKLIMQDMTVHVLKFRKIFVSEKIRKKALIFTTVDCTDFCMYHYLFGNWCY